ncbi:hypothetical protein [Lysobacter terrae]
MRHAIAIACVLASCAAGADAAPDADACPGGRLPTASIPIATQASAKAVVYYVRTDGGDAKECTGRADAAYPGKGSARACAWKSPAIALPQDAPRIAAGDVLLIAAGTYPIAKQLSPVPSGLSPAFPTRVIGKPGKPPKLVGIDGIYSVLSLEGSDNVELGNLEITDNSDCVYKHTSPQVACTNAMAWARIGLYARASRDVWLHDLDIHGMAARGINAGGLRNWTMERIKLNRNGTAGWDGNVDHDGPGNSNSGRIVIRNIEVAWNGCGERVATREPWACWAQKTGGYGDGFGTADTGGQWLIEDGHFHHNTSDGLDLRYMDGADSTSVTLRRIRAEANAGNQVKVKGNALIEDSVLVGYCSFFKNRFFMTDKDLCRADGSTLQLVLTGHDVVTVRRNTIAGEGAVQIGHSEGDESDQVVMLDNLVIGFPRFRDPALQSAFNGGKSPASKRFAGNAAWRVAKCPADTRCDANPQLANLTLAAFDARPGKASTGKAGAPACHRSR